ncbi:hypothetical protein C8Q77DRAFT_1044914 [Trametes polyzona]|nr:hypothetical protein C8Q77DRAFT_1044914 [Trametes polyzona]
MASTEAADPVQHVLKEEHPDTAEANLTPSNDTAASTHEAHEAGKGSGDLSGAASPAPSSPASGLSTTKGGSQTPATSGQAGTPPLSMPHPKKFSHVNINKKFLEKTSASSPSHTFAASPVTKTASTSQKPVLQTSTSHPRLVTAKLTATPQPSTAGPGWSRPSSAVPSAAPTPLPANSAKPSPSPLATPGGAPLPPPVGKVIQPQPRSSQDAVPQRKDASAKPVWGNTKPNAANPVKLDNDFPTAAEVAQGRIAKAAEKTAASEAAAVHKQSVMAELQAEEDTFRGVHLDPNAHHWDEMEEDDDNFLGGVIEFEDGRQYKVQSSDATPQAQSQQDAKQPASSGLTDQPVSKEERFADDFDRSWPRSRPAQPAPGQHREQRHDGFPASPSTSAHSPQESSRVLFNERSNRLEPYSHSRHGAPGPPFNRRGSRTDFATSPTEPRRDAPPHAHLPGVQVLQRGHHADGPSFSRAPGDRPPLSPNDGSRFRDRPPFQRDHAWQGSGHHDRYGPHAPGPSPRDGAFEDRTRRTSGPEPPSLSPSGDHRRQLPPHLSVVGARVPPPIRAEPPAHPQPPAHVPPVQHEPPPASASSQVSASPAVADKELPAAGAPIVDMEEVRKAAMHSAAERARLRRQQEEEEREKERERARRKAAELEEKMKALEQEKAREREKAEAEKKRAESEVVGIIEEAVSSASNAESKVGATEGSAQRHPEPRHVLGRNTSGRGTARPFGTRRTSFTPATVPVALPVQPSPASEVDSWRRKNPPPASVQAESQKPAATPVLPPPLLAHADLDVKAGEDVEVLDFSDHGKLAGAHQQPQQDASPTHTGRPPRAVASDFFGDATSPQRAPDHSRTEEETWRRGPPPRPAVSVHSEEAKPVPHDSQAAPSHPHAGAPNGVQSTPVPHTPTHDDHSRRVSSHYQNGIHRSPVGPSYREAPMSALNDVMARIKGALDGMHHEHPEPEQEPPKPQKWLPPALRSKPAHHDFAPPQEVFDVTSAEPPKSPKPAWNVYHVKLPHVAHPMAAPPKTELVWPRGLRNLQLEVYSFNPPIEALVRREGTVNDVLFNRPRIVNGRPKYFVSIPRRRLPRRPPPAETPGAPVVNLPSTPVRTRGPGLPKESASSTAATWRKAPGPSSSTATTWPPNREEANEPAGLDTVSRSPPPEAPSAPKAPEPTPATSSPASKAKLEPKMPVGSDVAFYRNSRVETAVESQPPVQFIVSSELESDTKASGKEVQPPKPTEASASAPAPAPPSEPVQQAPNGTTTPPPQPASLSPWSKSPKAFTTKESPARAPDPEHLKAVWSQTSDKAQIQPVNSLKGIADDLTGVPFTLQDVKSEDGETPPPSGAGPWSRMTSTEVTRAFQQVPSSSSSSSQRTAPITPSASTSTNGSAPRHPGFAFSPPPMGQPQLRAAYPTYSPMVSHTPSPTVMYSQPSPVPRHMVVPNGGVPAYGQAVWMPAMPGGGPPPSAGMIRSPYPPQMMPYPSPGATMPMYPAPMPMQNPPQNGVQGRPPGMAMMSPVMQPAMPPMYAGSPVLVPAPPVMPPGQGYPMPSQANRAPMRSPYEQNPANAPPQMHPSPMRQPPQNGYAPIPANYARPPW